MGLAIHNDVLEGIEEMLPQQKDVGQLHTPAVENRGGLRKMADIFSGEGGIGEAINEELGAPIQSVDTAL